MPTVSTSRLPDHGRDLQVRFNEFPDALLPVIAGDLGAVSFLVPPWCTFLSITYDAKPEKDPDVAASINVQVEYRQAGIELHPSYFSSRFGEIERRELLAHELVHIATGPVVEFLGARLRLLAQDGVLAKVLEEELRERVEGMTQDLSRAIVRRACAPVEFDPALMGPA